MAAFSFIQPPGIHLAGGGAYIDGLITALRAAGHDTTLETNVAAVQPGRVTVIDGLALPTIDPAAMADAVGLIHHTSALAAPDSKAAIAAIEHDLLPRLRRVVATSPAVAERLRDGFGVSPDRLAVVTPGLPDVPRSAGSDGPGCAILSVGALVPRKGHAVLLAALAKLFDLDWSLTIVGDEGRDPAHAAALRMQATTAGITGRVRFLGTPPALAPLLHQADLFALATEWEGYPASVALALRHGLPVAITSGGAAADLVRPECGVVVPVGDVVQLSKAMRRMIFDPGLRADMAGTAWRYGQSLPGWPAQAAKFVEAVS